MLHQLGWNASADADHFAEPVAIRRLNELCLREGHLDEEAAQQKLAKLPQPWSMKDPRFADILSHWLPLLLLFLTKPIDEVRASYARRGERLNADAARFLNAGRSSAAGRGKNTSSISMPLAARFPVSMRRGGDMTGTASANDGRTRACN